MPKTAIVQPNFTHRLASPGFEPGDRLGLYDSVSLMVTRIESTARLLAKIALQDRNLDLAEALDALSVDAEDIRETVRAWCEIESEETPDEGELEDGTRED